MNYPRFLWIHRRFLSFGLLAAWVSSFGQTFFLAFFNPAIRADFNLSHAEFGALYAVATLIGGGLLIWFGRQMDTIELGRYVIGVVLGLALSAILLATASSLPWVFLALCGLRLCGQGLMGHIAITSMARHFTHRRGRAVAIATLGFPLGEALLPAALVAVSAYLDRRETWWLIGAAILGVVLPTLLWSLKGYRQRYPLQEDAPHVAPEKEAVTEWNTARVVRDPTFYRILPILLGLPFALTAVFINQAYIAAEKGWQMTLLATGLLVFAVSRIGGSLVIGGLIDRFGSIALLALALMPLSLGLLGVALGTHPFWWLAFMALAGISTGANGALSGTIWAELYGQRHLGAIRSLYQALMVLAAGLAPLIIGVLIDLDLSVESVLIGLSVILLLATQLAPARQGHKQSVRG